MKTAIGRQSEAAARGQKVRRFKVGRSFVAAIIALSMLLLFGGTAWAHGEQQGWPYHKLTNAFCGPAGSFGNTTNTIHVKAPEDVFAFDNTAGADYEYVHWRGYVTKWYPGSGWVRIRTGQWSPGTVASESGLVEQRSWTGEDSFYQLPGGHLKAGVDIWWSSRSALHDELVDEHFWMPYNGFYEYGQYCTF